jgi:hypothetical protein
MLKENITSLKFLPEFETSKSGQILPNHPSLTGMSNAIAPAAFAIENRILGCP